MPRYSTRPATGEDFNTLYRIHCEVMKPYVEQVWGWDNDVQEQRFRRRFEYGSTQVVLFEGHEIGFLKVGEGNGTIFMAQIAIAPGYHGQGIGTALIQEVLGRGRPVDLGVLEVNPLARHLYERLGFRVTGESDAHHYMRAEP